MDPNSQNQIWSEWRFFIHEAGRHVTRPDVESNAARWLHKGFGSATSMRVIRTPSGWKLIVHTEGHPSHDPEYVVNVRRQFTNNFIKKGWGPMAWGSVEVRVLAGDIQDGTPRSQWVEVNTIRGL